MIGDRYEFLESGTILEVVDEDPQNITMKCIQHNNTTVSWMWWEGKIEPFRSEEIYGSGNYKYKLITNEARKRYNHLRGLYE